MLLLLGVVGVGYPEVGIAFSERNRSVTELSVPPPLPASRVQLYRHFGCFTWTESRAATKQADRGEIYLTRATTYFETRKSTPPPPYTLT